MPAGAAGPKGPGDLEPDEAARAEQLARRLRATLRAPVETLPSMPAWRLRHVSAALGAPQHVPAGRRRSCGSATPRPCWCSSPARRGSVCSWPASARSAPTTATSRRPRRPSSSSTSSSRTSPEVSPSCAVAPDRPPSEGRGPGRPDPRRRAARGFSSPRRRRWSVGLPRFSSASTRSASIPRIPAPGAGDGHGRDRHRRLARDAMPRAVILGDVKPEDRRPTDPSFASLDRTPAHGSTPHGLLEEFCTQAPAAGHVAGIGGQARADDRPPWTARRTAGRLRRGQPERSPVDAGRLESLGTRRRLEADQLSHASPRLRRRPPLGHRSASGPAIDVQLWGPNLDMRPADRWAVPARPPRSAAHPARLGARRVQLHAFPRHVGLTRHLFDRVGGLPRSSSASAARSPIRSGGPATS